MRDLAIVYWSATGNTEAMAAAVAEGARSTGAQVRLMTAAEASPDQLAACDGIAFGCPAMGAEQLEETEFEPLFSACEGRLNGKALALFGSYGCGRQQKCAGTSRQRTPQLLQKMRKIV